MEESSIPCSTEDGHLPSWRWNRSARDQVQIKPKVRDLPGLLKHGLNLRKKSSPDTIPGPSTGITPKPKTCSQSFPCAGRALRNAFLSHGPYPAKDKIHLARIIRRSYVGVELVQWLLEQCVSVQCRLMASRVWQVLLELGILHSVDQRLVFEDSNTYYQFSFEECDTQGCEFRNEEEWQNGVSLLLQLVPYVQFRVVSPPEEDPDRKRDICSEILQMKALERLTSTVQNELAAALARKAKKSMSVDDSSEASDHSPHEPPKTTEDNSKQAGVCAFRAPDDISRLEVVQRLAKDGYRFLQNQNYRLPERSAQAQSEGVVRVCLKERGQDVLVLKRVPSDPSSPQTAGVKDEDGDKRYVVVSGTPHKILEHLLSDLRLDEHQGASESKEAEMLLDDFLLTYLVFMSTSELCQALLGHYCTKRVLSRGKEEGKEALYRKRKVLHLVSQWSALYKDFLREEENVKLFMKTLYRYVLEDIYEFPTLEKDLKEFQKLLRRRHTVDDYSPNPKNKAHFQQLSLKENSVSLRPSPVESKEVTCHVYVSGDSYLSMRVKPAVIAQELLHIVAQRMDRSEDDMMLVAQTYRGEKCVLQPNDRIYSASLVTSGRLIACRRDHNEILPPLTECPELGQKPVRLLGINTWDVTVALTNFDWNLFNSIHEQDLIFYTFSRQASGGHTVALEFLLQRCNEVQQWVMSEVLLCPSLGKRVQLLKKFIKIAAHCKAQRNLNSSFAIIMGLNTAAVSRLNQTWEKVPGKFKKLFSELELLTDPSMNHKAYRDAFKKMKPPKIPFMPLLLKDITFIHEGNKTFHDNLVNFEKLHMIADTVRLIRHCQTDQTGNELSQCDSPEVRSSVHCLHIIDSQQTLFELSHRLEPRV
ncbi:rap guanine nucleotide exchange factor 5-like isoform X2 [Xyrauchen texanus]|uniref:rap guanine nucleotide exchange factor 5-like isoform X2 n=1 Tax=Xyrauchen texanus TaxID=154827 RepID=UPI00224250A0|nr:rap guanine nucleotide exchange factor 5-like isoform X2 [Xyrauchen texanus]